MAFTFDWMAGQQDIILVTITGNWTWDEFQTAHKQYVAVGNSIARRVDYIFDFTTATGGIPNGGFANIESLSRTAHEITYWGLSVLILPNILYRTMLNTFTKIYPGLSTHYRVAKTVDEALNIIAAHRN